MSVKRGDWAHFGIGVAETHRASFMFMTEAITFRAADGRSVTVTSARPSFESQFELRRSSAVRQAYRRTPEGRAEYEAASRVGSRPSQFKGAWRPVQISVDGRQSEFDVCDLNHDSCVAVGRLPGAAITIDSQRVPIGDIRLERLTEAPLLTLPDIGHATRPVKDALDARLDRFPSDRIRSMSDYAQLQAVEYEYLQKVTLRYGVHDGNFQVLQEYWMSRIDLKLADKMEELLFLSHLQRVREHRIHSQLAKYHHLDRLWWNTVGPGGQTLFRDRLPIHRLRFRIHWKP